MGEAQLRACLQALRNSSPAAHLPVLQRPAQRHLRRCALEPLGYSNQDGVAQHGVGSLHAGRWAHSRGVRGR